MLILILSVGVRIFAGRLSFGFFFEDSVDLWECVRLYFAPEIINRFRGEWGDASWADFKLFFYFGFSLGCGWLTHAGLAKWFG